MNNDVWWVLGLAFVISVGLSFVITKRVLASKPRMLKVLFAGLIFWVCMFLQAGIYAVVLK